VVTSDDCRIRQVLFFAKPDRKGATLGGRLRRDSFSREGPFCKIKIRWGRLALGFAALARE
jgi:hypothetical protein